MTAIRNGSLIFLPLFAGCEVAAMRLDLEAKKATVNRLRSFFVLTAGTLRKLTGSEV